MNVLVCIPCLLTGGTEIQTLSLVQALVIAGHNVTVACYFEHTPEMIRRYEESGATVKLLSPDGSRPVGVKNTTRILWNGFRHIVKEIKPDIAHVQYMAPGAIPIILLRMLGIKKIIATAHTAADIYSPSGLKIISLLNRHILNAFQCITKRAEKSFFGSSGLFDNNTKLDKHGNHFTIYNNLPSYISLRDKPRQFNDSEKLTIGVVSRLETIKGMDIVVPAFAEIHKDFPKTALLVVGDGSLRESMEAKTISYGLSDSVSFAGRQPQDRLQEFYDKIDILLMPSRSEGFGLTAVEGMARGCILVAADTGGLPEVVRNGKEGYLHRPEDLKDLSDKIKYLIKDRNRMTILSKAALQRARDFSSEKYNAKIRALYELLNNRSTTSPRQ